MIEAKRYVVQLAAQALAYEVKTAGKKRAFRDVFYTDDLSQARRHCALQVATNPRVGRGQVFDTQASGGDHWSMLVYFCGDPGTARADLASWGVQYIT